MADQTEIKPMHKHDPAIGRASRKYTILGRHGEDVITVASNVARVRMFVNGQPVDEDFPLPKPVTVEQQLEELVMQRISELERETEDAS